MATTTMAMSEEIEAGGGTGANLISPSDESENEQEQGQEQGQPSQPVPTDTSATGKQSRFLRINLSRNKSKEKASCEFYNEDSDLAEGELPSLKGRVPPRGVRQRQRQRHDRVAADNGNGSMNMDMNMDPTIVVGGGMGNGIATGSGRAVTPSPRMSRSSTPVQSNTKEKKKGGLGLGLRGRLQLTRRKDEKTNDPQAQEEEYVTYKAPRLSPESKQKHRVFWTQLDLDDDDEDDPQPHVQPQPHPQSRAKKENRVKHIRNETAPRSVSVPNHPPTPTDMELELELELPDDELADRRRQTANVQQRIQRPQEVAELDNDDDSMERGGAANGIYNIITDICSDCAWMGDKLVGGGGTNDANQESTRGRSTYNGRNGNGVGTSASTARVVSARRTPNSFQNVPGSTLRAVHAPTPRFDFEQTPAMADADDDDDDEEEEEEDDHHHDNDNDSENSNSRYEDGSYYDSHTVDSAYESLSHVHMHVNRANRRSTKAYENTAIEVEYVASHEDTDAAPGPGPETGPVQGGRASDGSFLQLDLSGEVSSFVKRDDIRSEGNYGMSNSMTHAQHPHGGGYLMSKTQSWSAPDKNAYLQAMAKKAKEDFRKKKGLEERKELQGAVQRGVESGSKECLDGNDDGGHTDDDNDTLDGLMNQMNRGVHPHQEAEDDHHRDNNILSSSRSRSRSMPRSKSFSHVITPQSDMSEKEHPQPQPQTSEEDNERKHAHIDENSNYDVESPTGVADFPNIDLYKSDTASDIGMRNQEVIGLKRVKSDFTSTSASKRGGILSSFRKKGGFDRVVGENGNSNASGSGSGSGQMSRLNNHPMATGAGQGQLQGQGQQQSSNDPNNVESPYEMRSSASIISFQRRKKKKWQQVGDEDEKDKYDTSMYSGSGVDVSNNYNLETPVAASDNHNLKESFLANDDIFNFNENSNDHHIMNGNGNSNSTPMTSVKLDPYEDSCDVSILGSTIGPGDDGSLYSSRSALTYGTSLTASSISTRHRHRGAAKKRRPAEEEAQNGRPSGWLESIKAAADSNNRKWDPKRGWVDYVPPPDPVEQDTSRIGRLKSSIGKRKEEDFGNDNESYVSEASNVPFPSEWESERERMVRSFRDDQSIAAASAVTEVVSNKAKETVTPVQEDSEPPAEIETKKRRSKNHKEFELGAHQTIEEGDDEEEPEFDNKAVNSSIANTSKMSIGSLPEPNFIPVDETKSKQVDRSNDSGVAENSFEKDSKDVGTDWIEEVTGEDNDASISLSITSDDVMGRTKSSPIPPKEGTTTSSLQSNPKIRSESPKSLASLQSDALASLASLPSAHVSVESEGYVQFSPGAAKSFEDNSLNEVKKDGSFDDGPDDFGANGSFDFSATDSNHMDDSDDGFKIVNEGMDTQQDRRSVSLSPSTRDTAIRKKMANYSPSSRDSPNQRKQPSDAKSDVSGNPSFASSSLSGFSQKKKPVMPSSPSSNSMASRAKDWLKKVENHKQRNSKRPPSTAYSNSNSDDKVESALFVSAADDTSTFEYGPRRVTPEADNDTLFEFEDNKSKEYARKNEAPPPPPPFRRPAPERNHSDSHSQPHHNDSMSEITGPSGVSASVRENSPKKTSRSQSQKQQQQQQQQTGTFFSRLQSCTAPVMDDSKEGGNMPMAHLEFLKKATKDTANCAPTPEITKEGQSLMEMFQSQTLCGSMENITSNSGLPPRPPSSGGSGTKGRSSIASTYLQAIKEKANGCGTNEGVPSVASTDSSKSESWQKFLDKRNKALESTSKRSSGSRGSKAAEQYASRKLEEIMSNISARATSTKEENNRVSADGSLQSSGEDKLQPPSRSQSRPRSRGRAPRYGKSSTMSRDDAARAAEDLAAAKVVAMMAMTSSTRLEEGEI